MFSWALRTGRAVSVPACPSAWRPPGPIPSYCDLLSPLHYTALLVLWSGLGARWRGAPKLPRAIRVGPHEGAKKSGGKSGGNSGSSSSYTSYTGVLGFGFRIRDFFRFSASKNSSATGMRFGESAIEGRQKLPLPHL